MKKITHLFLLTLLLASANAIAQLTPEVLYYNFDGSGTTVPNLASAPPVGTATATINGGLTQGGTSICQGTMIGSGVSSTTDYVNTGWAPNLGTGSWTISFRTENITASSTLFYIFGDVNTANFRCFTNGVAGANNWILRGAGLTDVLITGGATVLPHMNTFVYDATLNQVRAYLDGVLVNTVTQTAPNLTGTGPFKVVGYSANVGMPLNGHLDEFRLYSHALSTADVLQLYNPFSTSGFLGADQFLCTNSSATFSLSWPYGSALWSDNSTGSSLTVSAAGTYSVSITGNCGSGTDAVDVFDQRTSSAVTASACGNYTAPSGASFTSSGTYTDTITNVAGCDSIIAINLTINSPTTNTLSATACGSYTAPSGAVFTSSGTVMDTIANSLGCDSVLTINLTVNSPSTNTFSATVCGSYTAPSGAVFTSSGTVMDTIANSVGCDSILTINLTVNSPSTNTMSATVCGSYTAPSGAVYTSSGTYMDTIPNMVGCDSVITINLTLNAPSSSSLFATNCDSYISPAGNTYTNSGTYMDTIPNMAGCDSVITINLTINNSGASSITASSCGAYTAPSGAVFTSSGTYTDIIPNGAGCDSVITIALTVNTVNVGLSQNNGILTASASGATYQWLNCTTNTIVAGATSQSFTPTANGQYAVIVTQNNCTDTSSCVNVTGIGITESDFAQNVNMYPNPTSGNFTLELGNSYSDVLVTITDVTGRVVLEQRYSNSDKLSFNLIEPAGMYFVTVRTDDQKAVLKLTKE
jgi:Concanavalin A-like lectin/glucanases superfamily/Secretion system C-terminal sorting domain